MSLQTRSRKPTFSRSSQKKSTAAGSPAESKHFPAAFEQVLLSYVKSQYLPPSLAQQKNKAFNEKDLKFFSKGVQRLSDGFVAERSRLTLNYFNDPVMRSGYLVYFLPVNFVKVTHILEALPPKEHVTGRVRVLDLGSGPGTASLALMAHYAQLVREKKIGPVDLEITFVDRNFHVLKDARALHDKWRDELKAATQGRFDSTCSIKNYDLMRGGLDRLLRNMRFHVILAANALNEFPDRDSQVAFATDLVEHHLEPGKGLALVIEPALKKSSRDLQAVRDELVTQKKLAHILAPCRHQRLCPLNVVNKRDWCHFYFDWDCPLFVSQMDDLLGFDKAWLRCSYLLLKQGEPLDLSPAKNLSSRVISNLMVSKGKREVVICGPAGRTHLTRLDRDRSVPTGALDYIRRGDLVSLSVSLSGFENDRHVVLNKDDEFQKV